MPCAATNDLWWRQLLARASKVLARKMPMSFNAIVYAMDGADPILVCSLLNELVRTSAPVIRTRATAALTEIGCPAATPAVAADPRLPSPHPLDYEWRFTPSTCDRLVARVAGIAPRSVLLLGCPTVALALLSTKPAFKITLVDDNPALPRLNSLVDGGADCTQVRADLIARPEVTAGVNADVVIADAPFYPDAMAGFMCAAVIGSRPGARLLFVLPPSSSRPSARQDALDLMELAAASGLEHVATKPGGVRYLRPPFEVNAHHSAGLWSVADDWRAADLAEFRLASSPVIVARPTVSSGRERWREVLIESKRWRVQLDGRNSAFVDGLLEKIVGSAVLDSVSRRDKRRNAANVCTDDNEFFVTSNPALLLDVLDSISAGCDPVTRLERTLERRLSPTEFLELSMVSDLITGYSTSTMDVE